MQYRIVLVPLSFSYFGGMAFISSPQGWLVCLLQNVATVISALGNGFNNIPCKSVKLYKSSSHLSTFLLLFFFSPMHQLKRVYVISHTFCHVNKMPQGSYDLIIAMTHGRYVIFVCSKGFCLTVYDV